MTQETSFFLNSPSFEHTKYQAKTMFFALSQPKPGQENQVNLWGVNAIEQLNIIPHIKPTSNQT